MYVFNNEIDYSIVLYGQETFETGSGDTSETESVSTSSPSLEEIEKANEKLEENEEFINGLDSSKFEESTSDSEVITLNENDISLEQFNYLYSQLEDIKVCSYAICIILSILIMIKILGGLFNV